MFFYLMFLMDDYLINEISRLKSKGIYVLLFDIF